MSRMRTALVGIARLGGAAGLAAVFLAVGPTAGAAPAGPSVSCAPAPTDWTRGPVKISCTASSPVGLLKPSDANFDLVASVPDGEALADAATNSYMVCDVAANCTTAGPITGLKIDRAGPDVACSPTSGDWSPTDLVVSCLSTDQGSGLAHPSQASMSFSTSVAAGKAAIVTLPAVQVCDAVGNCTTAGPFGPLKVDKTVPTATCDPAPTSWAGTNVTIVCQVTDGASGLAQKSQSTVSLTTSVADGQVLADASTNSVKVCSMVGNCATIGPTNGLKVDRSVPRVSCVTPTNWSAGPVTVHCSAAEDASGLPKGADANFTLEASVKPGTQTTDAATGTIKICSAVGNCTIAGPVTQIKIDAAPPQITCSPAPAQWSSHDVTVQCNAAEAASGLADPADATFNLVAQAPANGWSADVSTGTKRVCSAVGLCATAGPVTGIRIDTTRPEVSCSAPPSGALTMNIFVSCTAKDDASGLANPADATFELATSVGVGEDQKNASTGSRDVCSLAGTCTTAGPFSADINRVLPASGAWPTIEVPKLATVVLGNTTSPEGSAFAYPLPSAHDYLGENLATVCSPGPSAPLQLGWSLVTCDATDGAGRQSVAGFPLLVEADPSVAPSGPAVAGGRWRVVGLGYRPGSAVTAAFDGTVLAAGKAGVSGAAAVEFNLPANAGIGEHEVTLLGTDPHGDPLAVLLQVRSTVKGPVAQGGLAEQGPASSQIAKGAPSMPADGAHLPRSPQGEPAVPAATHVTVPGASAQASKAGQPGPTTTRASSAGTTTTRASGAPTTTTTASIAGTTTTRVSSAPSTTTRASSASTTTTRASSASTTTTATRTRASNVPTTTTTASIAATTTTRVSSPGTTAPGPNADPPATHGAHGANAGGASWWIWLIVAVGGLIGIGAAGTVIWARRRA